MQKAHVPCFTWKAPISQIAAKKARYCWSKWILLEPWPNLRWWFIPAFFSQAGRVKRTSKDRQQFYRFPWFCVIYIQLINSEWFFYSVLGWVTWDFSTRQAGDFLCVAFCSWCYKVYDIKDLKGFALLTSRKRSKLLQEKHVSGRAAFIIVYPICSWYKICSFDLFDCLVSEQFDGHPQIRRLGT